MTRRTLVLLTSLIALFAFAGGAFVYEQQRAVTAALAVGEGDALVRPHAPIMGSKDAPVTIVEFFDPSCEACRSFYPIVKQIMGMFPNHVRLVLRYTPLHQGSDEAVRILESARLQGKFEPVLEVLVARQPEWAIHGAPDIAKAWAFAGSTGLDVERAKRDAASPAITRVLEVDLADVKANAIQRTPTFFVNGKPLTSFGPQQLYELVRQEVERSKPSS